jgi:hypothetical protein
MPPRRSPYRLVTQKIYTTGIILNKYYLIECYSRTPSTIAASHCLVSFAPVTMHSSGENSRKRKNDSVKRGEYRNFDQMSSQMRETLIKSCTEKVIAHAAENGGRCRLGFVKELVGNVSQRAPLLEITRDDFNNRVRIIKGQRKEEEQSHEAI